MPVTLVEDLVPLILDTTVWTTAELITLSLVSSAWLQQARICLYRHPTIISMDQCRYLVRTLQSVEPLQFLVKGINLWLVDPHLSDIELVPIRFVLGLEGLDCVSFFLCSMTPLMKEVTRPKPVRRIIILHVTRRFPHSVDILHSPIPHCMAVDWHPTLTEKFISLKKLVISVAYLYVTPSDANPYVFHLSRLIISQCNFFPGSLPDLLSPLSWSHLRNLTFIADSKVASDLDGMAKILSYCAEVLQSFHLEYRTHTPADNDISLDGLFRDALEGPVTLVSLRRLQLIDVVGVEQYPTALRTIGQRCPHLEVLKITARYFPSFRLRELAWPVDISEARLIFPQLRLLEGPSKVVLLDGEDQASNSAAYDCEEEW
jgi:hypothetical protein